MTPAVGPSPPDVVAVADDATAPRTRAARGSSSALPSVVKITADDIQIPEAEETKDYHVGTLESCPFQNVTLAGISFPRFTGGSALNDPQRRGARAKLSAATIAAVKVAVGRKICRYRKGADGSKVGGVIVSTQTPGFRIQQGDEWLAKHVYCVEIKPDIAKVMDEQPEAMA